MVEQVTKLQVSQSSRYVIACAREKEACLVYHRADKKVQYSELAWANSWFSKAILIAHVYSTDSPSSFCPD